MVRSNYFVDDYFITNLFSSYSCTVQKKLDCWNDWLMKDGLLLYLKTYLIMESNTFYFFCICFMKIYIILNFQMCIQFIARTFIIWEFNERVSIWKYDFLYMLIVSLINTLSEISFEMKITNFTECVACCVRLNPCILVWFSKVSLQFESITSFLRNICVIL